MAGNLRRIAGAFPARLAEGVRAEAEILLEKSRERCPEAMDGGDLRNSGKVTLERSGNHVTAVISYGEGPSAAYAVAVHETPSEHDPPSWRAMRLNGGEIQWTTSGTGPKFLESVIDESAPTLGLQIASRVPFE